MNKNDLRNQNTESFNASTSTKISKKIALSLEEDNLTIQEKINLIHLLSEYPVIFVKIFPLCNFSVSELNLGLPLEGKTLWQVVCEREKVFLSDYLFVNHDLYKPYGDFTPSVFTPTNKFNQLIPTRELLIQACLHNNEDLVTYLLPLGDFHNQPDDRVNFVIHEISQSEEVSFSIIKKITLAMTDPKVRDFQDNNALDIACRRQNEERVKFFLKIGFDINHKNLLKMAPIHHLLLVRTTSANSKLIQYILDYSGFDFDVLNRSKQNLLFMTFSLGNDDNLRMLLQTPALRKKINERSIIHGETLLTSAFARKDETMIRLLLSYPEVQIEKIENLFSIHGYIPSKSTLKLIFQHPNFFLRDHLNHRVLLLTIHSDSYEISKSILRQKPDLLNEEVIRKVINDKKTDMLFMFISQKITLTQESILMIFRYAVKNGEQKLLEDTISLLNYDSHVIREVSFCITNLRLNLKNKSPICCLLEQLLVDPRETIRNCQTRISRKVIALIVLVSDEYLTIKKEENETTRFFQISSRLPFELQMRLSNLSQGINKDHILINQREMGFREIVKVLETR